MISSDEETNWKWEITPKCRGLHDLHLVLNVLLPIKGTDEVRRNIQTFNKTIEVKVTLKGFFLENWKWLWTAIIVPIVVWLWGKW